MKRTKRSVWHGRDVAVLASKHGRPKSCPQWLWHWTTPRRTNAAYWGTPPMNGWSGGRDRDKPRRSAWHYWVNGAWLGGVLQYRHGNGTYTAYVRSPGGDIVREFGHRRDAKRWIEVESAKRRGDR